MRRRLRVRGRRSGVRSRSRRRRVSRRRGTAGTRVGIRL